MTRGRHEKPGHCVAGITRTWPHFRCCALRPEKGYRHVRLLLGPTALRSALPSQSPFSSGRELAVVGVGFTAAVFVTYFLLGLGAWGVLEGIKAYSVGSGISTALAYGVVCLTLALAAWSFVDFVRYLKSGDVKAVTLGGK